MADLGESRDLRGIKFSNLRDDGRVFEPLASHDSEGENPSKPDWETLARSMNLDSAEAAEKKAFEIANFIARVEKDKNKKLVLKTGSEYLELTLNR
jgi:hypothetical protein